MTEDTPSTEATFDGGFLPVNAELIERRLADIWREANTGDKADRGWSKLCLANTIIITDSRTRPEAETTAYALAELHPSRTLLIVIDDFPTYGAFVRTACRVHPETRDMICWEVIEILTSRERIDDIPGAIRSLVVPSIPVLTIDFSPWQLSAEFDREVMELSDFYLASDDPFPSRQIHPAFLPLAWFVTLPVRELLSTMFGHYQRNHAPLFPTAFEIAAQEDKSHQLLGGWLLYRLQVTASATSTGDEIEVWLNGREMSLRIADLPISESSITLLRIHFSDESTVEISAERGADGSITGYSGRHGDFRTSLDARRFALSRYVLESIQDATELDEYHAAVDAARKCRLAPKE